VRSFSLRHALREARSGARRVGWFMGAIVLGVAVLVALHGFREDASSSAVSEARYLLGGDLRLQSNSGFDVEVEAFLDSLVAEGARVARGTSLASVVSSPESGGARLLQVNAVDGAFPAVGRPVGVPADVPLRLAEGGGVAVDPQVLDQLGVQTGDELQIGNSRFQVYGALSGVPVDFGLQWVVGPPVFMSMEDLDATGLVSFGSIAQHRAWIAFDDGVDVGELLRRYRGFFQARGVSLRTADQEADAFATGFEGLTRFLGLVGLIAVLLGGIGVGSAVSLYLKEKRETMAVLRCMGAGGWTLFRAYLLQIAVLGFVGGAAGVFLGSLVQFMAPAILSDVLPFPVTPQVRLEAIVGGLILGTWVSVVFALPSLLGVRRVSPLQALRASQTNPALPLRHWAVSTVLLGGSVLAVAAVQLGGMQPAAIVTGGLLLVVLALGGVGRGLSAAVQRVVPSRAPFALRQGLSGLGRPGNQTLMVVIALGLGSFLAASVVVVEHGLRGAIEMEVDSDAPQLVLFDIQPDQREGVTTILETEGLAAELIPLVPATLASISGVPVSQILDRVRPRSAWMYRRVYRNTYRSFIGPAERMVEGSWWGEEGGNGSSAIVDAVAGGALRVSLEADLARDLGVGIADEIVWDVQGVLVRSVITSIREVEWASFEPNFFAVFEPGGLEGAPATFVALVAGGDRESRLRVQNAVLRDYSNVSFIDVTTVQETFERISGQLTTVLRSMASLILAGAGLVLLASLLTTRFQRRREAALLKTLGARSGVVRGALFTEYATLGMIGGAVGVGLGGVGGSLLLRWFFDLPGAVGPWLALLVLWSVVILLAVVVGWSISRPILTSPAISILREES
jgi:putative ABC transport system permease protein